MFFLLTAQVWPRGRASTSSRICCRMLAFSIPATVKARARNSGSSSMKTRLASGGLPAMSAALMAPIEVPITQSGSIPASCRAS